MRTFCCVALFLLHACAGDPRIERCALSGSITVENSFDIEAIEDCETITGDLVIRAAGLDTFDLPKLKEIGRDLVVIDNDVLTALGLENVTSIGRALVIGGNQSLVDLRGLERLGAIGGVITIAENALLGDLDGLGGLTTIEELAILDNPVLTNVNALSGVEAIGGDVTIRGNDELATVDGLMNVKTIDGVASIWGAWSETRGVLSNIELDELTSVGGISIVYNASLTKVSLAALANAGGLHVGANPAIESIDVGALTTVTGDVNIAFNDVLSNVDTPSLTEVSGDYSINGNRNLELLASNALQYVGGFEVSLEWSTSAVNESLTTISCPALIQVGQNFEVSYNPVLTTIDMPNLTTVLGERFEIEGNARFPTCEAESLASQLVEYAGQVDISSNDDTATCE